MSDRNGKVVEEKVPLRRADTLKKNRWRKSGTGMTFATGIYGPKPTDRSSVDPCSAVGSSTFCEMIAHFQS